MWKYVIVYSKNMAESLVVLKSSDTVGKDLRFDSMAAVCPGFPRDVIVQAFENNRQLVAVAGRNAVVVYDEENVLLAYNKAIETLKLDTDRIKVFRINVENKQLHRIEVAPKDIPTFPVLVSAYGGGLRGSLVLARTAALRPR